MRAYVIKVAITGRFFAGYFHSIGFYAFRARLSELGIGMSLALFLYFLSKMNLIYSDVDNIPKP